MRKISVILGFLCELQHTQTSVARMLSLSTGKTRREDFKSEEWQEFVDCYQQALSLEYSLTKLKCRLHEWVPMDADHHLKLNTNLIPYKKN